MDGQPAPNATQFQSPSGNLLCVYRPALDSITCGRYSDLRVVTMTSTGRAHEAHGTASGWWEDEAARTLRTVKTYRGIGARIRCFSGSNGMRCTSYRGHGFLLSRTIFKVW